MWRPHLIAFAAYAALAVVTTFPLALHLSSRLPKDLGDPLIVTSILWWNAHVMPFTERWWNGFGFFPAGGMMAFSEHFVGASLLASPLQWLGLDAVGAYNVTLLASFPLCAIAAHALAWTLTRRHDAAIVCGLAYGFNPYRVAHIEHLELLLSFGMPAALAALHLYAGTRRARWLIAFAAALAVQALSSSYYTLFFTVLLGLWILWFVRPHEWRRGLAILAAACIAALVVIPLARGYSRIHERQNLARDFTDEVLRYSADLSSLVTASPLSALWGWTASLNGAERQLFPGLTIAALVLAGIVARRRFDAHAPDRLAVASKALWGAAAAFAGIALWARVAGPALFEWGWLRISVGVPYKPLSLATAFAILALALTPTIRAAFRRRSAFTFYVVAAAVLFLCSLGPRPTLLGAQILYEPPYAWLMRLPFFADTVRVPARFGMLGVLALSVAASLAFSRLTSLSRHRTALLTAALIGIVGDGWIRALPLATPPQTRFRISAESRTAAVMELPLGDVFRDTAALYRASFHRTPTVNGYNGYEPSYYQALRRALDDRDATILDALAPFGPLLIATDGRVDPDRSLEWFLLSHADVRRVGKERHWTMFRLQGERRQPPEPSCPPTRLQVTAVNAPYGPIHPEVVTDQDPETRWITAHPQRVDDWLVLDLGDVRRVCGLVLSLGSAAVLYPGVLGVATSTDNVEWHNRFVGAMGGPAFRAALDNPGNARISFALREQALARYVRLRVRRSQPFYPWAVADVVLYGR